VGCWAHARRKFVALAETDYRVAYPLQLIRRLYRVEYLGDLRDLDPEGRAALHAEYTHKALTSLQHWLRAMVEQEPPSSEMAKAVNYCLNHWTALNQFLDDGRLSPDNNVCEQQLRDVALGTQELPFRRVARCCASHRCALQPHAHLCAE
jgi:hypothetical protein